MASPSKNPNYSRGLFRRAFREASPVFGRSLNDSNEPEIEPNVQISEEEIEFARRMTSSSKEPSPPPPN